jgi:GMP synthase-like glutamine amidotransferase
MTTVLDSEIAAPTELPGASTPGSNYHDFSYGPETGLDGGHTKLDRTTEPIVVFLDTIHPDWFPRKLPVVQRNKAISEELSGLPCIVVHYSHLAEADMRRGNIKAIFLGASLRDIPELLQVLYPFIRETQTPMIGTCGGNALLYTAYGGKDGLMRPLRPGEPDPNPNYHPGYYKEWGKMPVSILKRDPLFEDLPDSFIVQQNHSHEAKMLPPCFEVLAASPECRVQAIKHKAKLHYGVQSHPEYYDDQHLHGKIILRNFFRLALGK